MLGVVSSTREILDSWFVGQITAKQSTAFLHRTECLFCSRSGFCKGSALKTLIQHR